MEKLINTIEKAWQARDTITPGDWSAVAVREALALLDRGEVRIAAPSDAGWQVNTWLNDLKEYLEFFTIQFKILNYGFLIFDGVH